MEYADGGNLRQYLSRNFKNMDWNMKLNFAKQIAGAVFCLHKHEIVHRDLVSIYQKITYSKSKIKYFLIFSSSSTRKTSLFIRIM